MNKGDANESQHFVVREVRLILAEKRSSLAVVRAGIVMLVLPLTVMTFLLVISKHYGVIHEIHLLIPLLLFSTALLILGAYFIIKEIINIHHQDRLIREIKKKHSWVGEFID
jgi:hypothetical protein